MIIPITTGSGKTVSGCSIPGCDRPSRFWRVNRLTRDGVRICCVDCTDAVTASPLLFDPCGHSMACNDTLSTSWFREWRRQQGNQGPVPTPAPSPTVPSVPPPAPLPTPAARRPLAPALRRLLRAIRGTYDVSESERRAQGAIYRSITSPAPTSEPAPSLTVPTPASFVRRYFPTPASARSSVPPSVPSPAPTSEPPLYYARDSPGATLCLVSAERLAAIAALAKTGKRRAERAAESSDSDSGGLW